MVSRTPSPDYLHPSLRHEMSRLPVPRTPRRSPQADPLVPPFLVLPFAAGTPVELTDGSLGHRTCPQPGMAPQRSLAAPLSRPALKAAWSPTAIKVVSEQISALQTSFQSAAAGQLQKSALDNLLNMVPLEVQALYPRLHSLHAAMKENEDGTVGNACGSQFLAQLARLVANAEAWHESILGQSSLSANPDEKMSPN